MGGRPPQSGYRRFPLARLAPHLRLEARHGRCRFEHRARAARAFRLRDDAALCAPSARAQSRGGCKAGDNVMGGGEIRYWGRRWRAMTEFHAILLEGMMHGWPPDEEEAIAMESARERDDPERYEILNRRASRFIGTIEIPPQDVMAILAEIGVQAASPVILETLASACTPGAALLKLDRRPGRPSKRIEREANNALATLRRVLPEIIDWADFIKDMRVAEYRELFASIEKVKKFATPEPLATWHSIAQVLTGIYRLYIDIGAEELPRGRAIRFAQLALSK